MKKFNALVLSFSLFGISGIESGYGMEVFQPNQNRDVSYDQYLKSLPFDINDPSYGLSITEQEKAFLNKFIQSYKNQCNLIDIFQEIKIDVSESQGGLLELYADTLKSYLSDVEAKKFLISHYLLNDKNLDVLSSFMYSYYNREEDSYKLIEEPQYANYRKLLTIFLETAQADNVEREVESFSKNVLWNRASDGKKMLIRSIIMDYNRHGSLKRLFEFIKNSQFDDEVVGKLTFYLIANKIKDFLNANKIKDFLNDGNKYHAHALNTLADCYFYGEDFEERWHKTSSETRRLFIKFLREKEGINFNDDKMNQISKDEDFVRSLQAAEEERKKQSMIQSAKDEAFDRQLESISVEKKIHVEDPVETLQHYLSNNPHHDLLKVMDWSEGNNLGIDSEIVQIIFEEVRGAIPVFPAKPAVEIKPVVGVKVVVKTEDDLIQEYLLQNPVLTKETFIAKLTEMQSQKNQDEIANFYGEHLETYYGTAVIGQISLLSQGSMAYKEKSQQVEFILRQAVESEVTLKNTKGDVLTIKDIEIILTAICEGDLF